MSVKTVLVTQDSQWMARGIFNHPAIRGARHFDYVFLYTLKDSGEWLEERSTQHHHQAYYQTAAEVAEDVAQEIRPGSTGLRIVVDDGRVGGLLAHDKIKCFHIHKDDLADCKAEQLEIAVRQLIKGEIA